MAAAIHRGLRGLLWAGLALALMGCLSGPENLALGPMARPLPDGVYVEFDEMGEPQNALVLTSRPDGIYRHSDFDLRFFESGLGEGIYFVSYLDRGGASIDGTLYGVVEVRGDAVSYPLTLCGDAPADLRAELQLDTGDGASCEISDPEVMKRMLEAIWRATKGAGSRQRWVRQTTLRR
ncbi:MAG: hypothetical protein AAF909_05560 [Pseudomonadota bacterium]